MKKFWINVAGVLSSVVLAVGLFGSATASAFSGIGAGTAANPYRIATCAGLHQIDNNLGAYYVLAANIDCGGSTFTHLADSANFTGTLDGKNHTITNLAVDSMGLFRQTSGATIKNLTITNGTMSNTNVYAGSFVGYAQNTTMQNLHSDMAIASTSYGYLGGIAGFMDGSTVSGSSFSGSLGTTDTDSYIGGITGFMWLNAPNTITDSFVTGTLTPPSGGSYTGGIVGGDWGGSIARVYSSANINLTNSYDSGGLVGLFASASGTPDTLSDSFSASTLTTTGATNSGAVFGIGSDTATNNFYDGYLAGLNNCSGTGAADCTAENAGNAVPNYFKNNTTNGPFSSWDFANVWQTTSGYPTLRNIAAFTPAIPNNGDANDDSIADGYQPNVLSVQDSSGVWATVEVPTASSCQVGDGQSTLASGLAGDSGYAAKVNYTGFAVYCPTAGSTVQVTVIYDKVYTGGLTLRFYNASTHSYSTVSGVTFGTANIGGVSKTTATYSLTDGSVLDEDGSTNEVILDPVALVVPVLTNTGVNVALSTTMAATTTALALIIWLSPRFHAREK